MLRSLLYVSRSKIDGSDADRQLEQIVMRARVRNRAGGVTGALIFTGSHFAQVIEGPLATIDELIARIRRDDRHCEIEVIAEGSAKERRFDDWSLAYGGPSAFVRRHLSPLLDRGGTTFGKTTSRDAEIIVRLMAEFVASNATHG